MFEKLLRNIFELKTDAVRKNWRKTHDIMWSFVIFTLHLNLRKMKLVGNFTRREEMRYNILVWRTRRKKTIRKWENNFEMDFTEVGCKNVAQDRIK
jgi:hypothetical protein